MFLTYLLWGSVFYTAINIPYGSMASAITSDPKERQSLSTARTIGGSLAGVMMGVILPVIVYYKDASGNTVLSDSRMVLASLVCSIGALITYAICYFMGQCDRQFQKQSIVFDSSPEYRSRHL
jgi:Na+/melibiose symporter and related transporters